jgi:hypothetical protein
MLATLMDYRLLRRGMQSLSLRNTIMRINCEIDVRSMDIQLYFSIASTAFVSINQHASIHLENR